MQRAGIKPVAIGPLRPALLPYVLRLPDFLFRLLARRMIAVDPQGAILDLAGSRPRAPHRNRRIPGRRSCALPNRSGTAAPLSRLVLERIRAAEAAGKGSPRLTPDDLCQAA